MRKFYIGHGTCVKHNFMCLLLTGVVSCPIVYDMSTQPISHGWRPDDTSFGARLALVRQRMGWGNVKEAALACGQPVESWRSWERDGRQPRDYMRICGAISERTGVDLAWLVGIPGDPITVTDPAAPTADRLKGSDLRLAA